jgi:hypothetical protein
MLLKTKWLICSLYDAPYIQPHFNMNFDTTEITDVTTERDPWCYNQYERYVVNITENSR